jgi:hypothetical protein
LFLAPSGGFAATSPASGEGYARFFAPSGGFAATSPASGEGDYPKKMTPPGGSQAAPFRFKEPGSRSDFPFIR